MGSSQVGLVINGSEAPYTFSILHHFPLSYWKNVLKVI